VFIACLFITWFTAQRRSFSMELFDANAHRTGQPRVFPDTPSRYPAFEAQAPAVSDAPMDIVYINGFTGQTVIGIDASELRDPQPVRMSIAIGLPSLRACETDRIEDTVNYAAVHDALHLLLASHGVQLLERLAEKVAQLLISDFGAHWVRVSLAKPAKFDDVESVGVLIERRRAVARAQDITCAFLGEGLIPN
jgi:7,8-dihydroneopterin aldolase/epimerase/oxygenase